MKKMILLSFLILAVSLDALGLHSNSATFVNKPFTYTIIIQNVDYKNRFDLENGIKTRTRFKCPLYYVDSLGLITEICPDIGTNDTVTIHHIQDQLEIVHSIRGINFFYYMLNEGDTLSLKYENGIPIAKNPKQNTCYNLIEDNPFEKIRGKYYMVNGIANRVYKEFKNKNEIPIELERFKLLYKNLDSLYQEIKKSHAYQIDFVRHNSDSSDYWESILNKEMRRLILLSEYINNSDISLYGSESDFDVYSISDQLYYKTKFNQNPDSIFKTVQNNGPGINSDLARYYYQLYLEKFAEKESITSINNLIVQYYDSFSQHRDTVFIQGLRKKMGVEESIAEDIKIRNKAGVETNLNQLIRHDSASLYYVDYWASWCAPCRKEIPYSIDLKKELEGRNIRFIYLAYNDRMDNWKKASEDLNLSQYHYSYFITNSRSSQQLIDYNIKTIPRYMILDKDGKVIVANAQRPSDPALKKLLLKNLNK